MGHFVGPDLTSVSRRFTRRDLLMSVLNPSLVVSEKYRNVQIITNDGRTITGRAIASGYAAGALFDLNTRKLTKPEPAQMERLLGKAVTALALA